MNLAVPWAARPAPPSALRRPLVPLAVLAGHGLVLWGLSQLDVIERALVQAAPLVVRIVAPAEPARPAPALPLPLPRTAPPPVVALVVPEVEVQRPPPPATPLQAVSTPPPAVPAPPAPSPAAAVAAAAPPPPPAAPAPLKVAAGQLRYLVEPPIEVPRMSRRLREQGTVLVHVVVDARGLPRHVSLARSSGFDRLDQQALSAMREARFVPCTSQGQPVECESDAPFVYELEN